jgi:hypothetical protein
MAPLAAQRGMLWWPYRSPRIDYPLTWSGPEGSSHSGNIECRGVAGGAASISGVGKPQSAANAFFLSCFSPNAPTADSFISRWNLGQAR